MNIIGIVSVAILGVVLCIIVKQEHPSFAIAIGIVTGVIILLYCLTGISEVVDFVSAFIDASGIKNDNFKIILKAVGICYITQFTADLCIDAGETSIASKIELAGRIAILVISLPMIQSLFQLLMDVLEMG